MTKVVVIKDCECDKLCGIKEYLDYENCKCSKRIVDKLVEGNSIEECSENIDENEMTLNAIPLNDYGNVCNSCTIYIVLFGIFLIISTIISSAFVDFHWYFF